MVKLVVCEAQPMKLGFTVKPLTKLGLTVKPFDKAGLHERAAYQAGGAQRQTLKKLNVTQSDCRRFLPGENTPDLTPPERTEAGADGQQATKRKGG